MATSSEPLFLGFQTIFGHGLTDARPGAGRLHRADRELPHHHLRLRPADLFAFARRIFSDVAFGDARQTRDAAARAAGWVGAGLRGGAGDSLHAAGQPGGRDPAEHGGVRRGAGIHVADGVVPAAALAIPGDRAALRESRWASPERRSPLILAAVTLATLFRNPDYNKGVIGAAVWFVLGVGYYAVYARKRLVLSPEEEAAIGASPEKRAGA